MVGWDNSIVRIFSYEGGIAGAGFLISENQIITCAHVVVQATGGNENISNSDDIRIHLDFPFTHKKCEAQLLIFDAERDIAILLSDDLKLDKNEPEQYFPLVISSNLWGHSFQAFGFPTGYDNGVWASGVLRGAQAQGLIQIEDIKQTGYWVRPGFSGTPVWDEQLNGVVGIIIAAEARDEIKAAYLIPSKVLAMVSQSISNNCVNIDNIQYLDTQLGFFKSAQKKSSEPHRFQAKINFIKSRIENWNSRIQNQERRITDGLDEFHSFAFKWPTYTGKKIINSVGQKPLGLVDFFKNRDKEFDRAKKLLLSSSTRLISILGHGGIGKTALACKLLRDIESNMWPIDDLDIPISGIIYLSTRTDGITLENIFLAFAKLIGGEKDKEIKSLWANSTLTTNEKISNLFTFLIDGKIILLLDNFDEILDNHGNIVEQDFMSFIYAVTHSSKVLLMITSRIALPLEQEILLYNNQIRITEGLSIPDSIALLRDLDVSNEYGLQEASEDKLSIAANLAHGVPRALEAIVGILASDPFISLADILDEFYKEATVLDFIKGYYKHIDHYPRLVIDALAVYKRPVTTLAIDYLLQPFASGIDVPDIVKLLVKSSIVNINRTDKSITLHPIDQDFAYNQLPITEYDDLSYAKRNLERRAAEYYHQLRSNTPPWKDIVDLEPAIFEFEHLVKADDFDDAAKLLEEIDHDYLTRWGYARRVVAMREILEGKISDKKLQGMHLAYWGYALYSLGDYEKAFETYNKALSLNIDNKNEFGELFVLGNIGRAYQNMPGQLDLAIKFYKRASNLALKIKNLDYASIYLGLECIAHSMNGQYDDAIECGTKSLEYSKITQNQLGEGRAFSGLGIAYQGLKQYSRSLEYLKLALISSQKLNDARGEGFRLGHIGNLFYELGLYDQAIKFQKDGLDLAIKYGARYIEMERLIGLGMAYKGKAEFDLSNYYFLSASKIAKEIKNSHSLSKCYVFVAENHLLQNKMNNAITVFVENEILVDAFSNLIKGIAEMKLGDKSCKTTFQFVLEKVSQDLIIQPSMYKNKYIEGLALIGIYLNSGVEDFLQQTKIEEVFSLALLLNNSPGVVNEIIKLLDLTLDYKQDNFLKGLRDVLYKGIDRGIHV
jgi:tetratricopeptide (TPR) repeat protein